MTVQDIDNARGALDDWGYAERPIRGGTDLSNHASGTAIDLNATRWPLGSDPSCNLNPSRIAACDRIVAATGAVVRWGGRYVGRKDPMHWELSDGTTEQDCTEALARLLGTGAPVPPPSSGRPVLALGSTGPAVAELQRVLARWYPSLHLTADGQFGPATDAAVRQLQRGAGLVVDGVTGADTYRALGM